MHLFVKDGGESMVNKAKQKRRFRKEFKKREKERVKHAFRNIFVKAGILNG